jgi:hypothetical protein
MHWGDYGWGIGFGWVFSEEDIRVVKECGYYFENKVDKIDSPTQ